MQRGSRPQSRSFVGVLTLDLDVALAPGDDVAVDVTAPDGDAIALDADLDAQARCEGRFDRT